MICKYCNGTIDERTKTCSSCGRPVELTGGNSFYSAFQYAVSGEGGKTPEPHPQRISCDNTSIQKAAEGVELLKKRFSTLSVLSTLLCAGLVVLLATQWMTNANLTGRIKDLQKTQGQIQKQLEETLLPESQDETFPQETVQKTEANPEESTTPAVHTPVPEIKSDELEIVKSPSSELHVVPGKTALVFTVQAKGLDLRFQWEKFDFETGEWVDVSDMLGIFKTESEGNESRLSVENAGEEHEGVYRCVVSSGEKSIYSDCVLFRLEKQQTESSTPQETGDPEAVASPAPSDQPENGGGNA